MAQLKLSLCEQCVHGREVISGKGSRFLRCELSTADKAYPKYPPQPVLRCPGFSTDVGETVGDS